MVWEYTKCAPDVAAINPSTSTGSVVSTAGCTTLESKGTKREREREGVRVRERVGRDTQFITRI